VLVLFFATLASEQQELVALVEVAVEQEGCETQQLVFCWSVLVVLVLFACSAA
jgi:hypothetical protein